MSKKLVTDSILEFRDDVCLLRSQFLFSASHDDVKNNVFLNKLFISTTESGAMRRCNCASGSDSYCAWYDCRTLVPWRVQTLSPDDLTKLSTTGLKHLVAMMYFHLCRVVCNVSIDKKTGLTLKLNACTQMYNILVDEIELIDKS